MKGCIQKRGPHWRLKFDLGRDPTTRRRITRYVSFRGTKREAQNELARVISQVTNGTFVDPTKATLSDYLKDWIGQAEDKKSISLKTAELYRGLIENQINPHLGSVLLQKLRPSHIAAWHATLLSDGRRNGGALSARSILNAHRVLGKALADAVRHEALLRNVAAAVSPPKVTAADITILTSDQVQRVLDGMRDTPIFAQVVVLLGTGMRRGELLGLRWSDLDLELARLRIERSIEVTKAGLRIKSPKTKAGRRIISLPASAVEALRQYRKERLEERIGLGLGKLPDDAFVFGNVDDDVQPRDPTRISQDWKRFVRAHGLPRVTLHALRHTHASSLIASGLDIVSVSRRLGHGSPTITLSVYAHLFNNSDERAAAAIEAMLTPAGPVSATAKDTPF
jgi:integrase